jgi:hypothetical protein
MGLARSLLYVGYAETLLFLHAPLLSQLPLQFPNKFAALAL